LHPSGVSASVPQAGSHAMVAGKSAQYGSDIRKDRAYDGR
jgi:hypothetical protein